MKLINESGYLLLNPNRYSWNCKIIVSAGCSCILLGLYALPINRVTQTAFILHIVVFNISSRGGKEMAVAFPGLSVAVFAGTFIALYFLLM